MKTSDFRDSAGEIVARAERTENGSILIYRLGRSK